MSALTDQIEKELKANRRTPVQATTETELPATESRPARRSKYLDPPEYLSFIPESAVAVFFGVLTRKGPALLGTWDPDKREEDQSTTTRDLMSPTALKNMAAHLEFVGHTMNFYEKVSLKTLAGKYYVCTGLFCDALAQPDKVTCYQRLEIEAPSSDINAEWESIA